MEDDLYCGSCGLVFTLDDVDDLDDVICPDCGSQDIGSVDDIHDVGRHGDGG